MQRSAEVYTAATISGPFLLTMMLKTANETLSAYPMVGMPQAIEFGGTIAAGNYLFPAMQAESLVDVDRMIRPLCDQAHQMFGRDSSPCFNADPYRRTAPIHVAVAIFVPPQRELVWFLSLCRVSLLTLGSSLAYRHGHDRLSSPD